MRKPGRLVVHLTLAALAALAAGCSDATSAPKPPLTVPSFIFVSNRSGDDELYTYANGQVTLWPATAPLDDAPQSAAGRVVFMSYRIDPANAEIFSAKLDGSDLQRLTNNSGYDGEPSLSPDGSTVAFTTLRSGVLRVWTMSADGTNQAALATGSDAYTFESHPRYSPDGTQLLFHSTRTGTNQVFVVAASGGTAVQVTHEPNGAFDAAWTPDGSAIAYIDGSDASRIHLITLASGDVTDYATNATDVGQLTCAPSLCLAITHASSGYGDVVAYQGPGAATATTVVSAPGSNRSPAFLVP